MTIIKKDIPQEFEKDIKKATEILLKEGCLEIYIFGSIANGNTSMDSDIDFAVIGLPKGKLYKIGAMLNMALSHEFDLIKLDNSEDNFSRFIAEKEVFIRVA